MRPVTILHKSCWNGRQSPSRNCEAIYRRLDQQYNMVERPPKSDMVCRMIANQFGWNVPDKQALGWDFKPLLDDYTTPVRIRLVQMAKNCQLNFQSSLKMKGV